MNVFRAVVVKICCFCPTVLLTNNVGFVFVSQVTVLFFLFGRNDVWKYQGYEGIPKTLLTVFGRGFKLAAVLMVITIAVDKTIGLKRDLHLPPHAKYGERHDHHGSSEHHEHH